MSSIFTWFSLRAICVIWRVYRNFMLQVNAIFSMQLLQMADILGDWSLLSPYLEPKQRKSWNINTFMKQWPGIWFLICKHYRVRMAEWKLQVNWNIFLQHVLEIETDIFMNIFVKNFQRCLFIRDTCVALQPFYCWKC